MSKIQEAFRQKKAFIPFITGGDPDLETTEALIEAMAEEGADLIEIGIPFSDPTAEGAVIQAANQRALQGGCTTDALLECICRVRKKVSVPIVFLTYANPVFSYGTERFLQKCQQAQVDGILMPDVPYEEKEEFAQVCGKHGIDFISMIAPTSHERIAMIAKEAKGFLYCVSSLGVTGVRSEVGKEIQKMITVAKENTTIPCGVGFGIATPAQATEMATLFDGVIVGSAIVKQVEEHGRESVPVIREYVRRMRAAMDTV